MWMSWKHLVSDFPNPLTHEQKVEIFYEQTLGWQLHIADLIANGGTTFGQRNPPQPGYVVPSIWHSGFAVLQICLSYFELVGSLVSSKSSSTERFKSGVRSVLPSLFTGAFDDDLLKPLYKGARCGLYRVGRTMPKVGLGQPSDGSPIAYDSSSGVLIISPERLPKALKTHLDDFKISLLDAKNTALQTRFGERFDAGFE